MGANSDVHSDPAVFPHCCCLVVLSLWHAPNVYSPVDASYQCSGSTNLRLFLPSASKVCEQYLTRCGLSCCRALDETLLTTTVCPEHLDHQSKRPPILMGDRSQEQNDAALC